MRPLSKTENLLFRIGALLMVGGAAAFLVNGQAASVAFAFGAVLFAAMQLRTVYEGRNFVVGRLPAHRGCDSVVYGPAHTQ